MATHGGEGQEGIRNLHCSSLANKHDALMLAFAASSADVEACGKCACSGHAGLSDSENFMISL